MSDAENFFLKMQKRYPELINSLQKAEAKGKLAHAFLIVSSSPRARREFAAMLAMIASCPTRCSTLAPNSDCLVCRQIAAGNSPDIITLSPQGKSYQIKVGDADSRNEPNTMRFFQDSFYLTNISEARRKVGIVYDADRMNKESQNAFLKTLEEPPPETLLILTTGSPASLLPTTRSRCQEIVLPESHFEYEFPGREELYDILRQINALNSGDVARAETISQQLIGLTKSLREKASTETAQKWQSRLDDAQRSDDKVWQKNLAEQADDAAAGEYINVRREFLSAIQAFFAQLYYLALGATPETLANGEMLLDEDGKLIDIPAPERATTQLEAAENLLRNLKYNINEELALRNFLMQIVH